jgi:hypothetical protein
VYRSSLHSLIICVTVAVCLSASPLVNAAAQSPVRAGVFKTRLESDKAAYRVGEAIRLRVTFINSTDHYLNYKWMPVWGLSGLIVYDGHGNLVVSKGNRGGFVSTAATAQFTPREVSVADFPDPESGRNSQWARLDYWGYSLNKPGVYTIAVFPTMAAWESDSQYSQKGGPEFLTSPADKSNSVRITIVK